MKPNNIQLSIAENYESLSLMAATVFSLAVADKPQGNYGFATGSTPEGMYDHLVRLSNEGKLDMSKIVAFNLDEYVGLPATDPQSYAHYMAHKLFDPTNVPVNNRYIPNGMATDFDAECEAYELKIATVGGIDLQILGIGTNGHIGFNEPEDIFAKYTSHVPLAQATVDANARFFEDPSQVPRYALSMGIQSIMMAKRILLLASGPAKAQILNQALTGPITPQVPASALQLHRHVEVIADKAAAECLDL